MKTIEGNILDVTEGYILQQVNCQGVMGSGLAKQIRDKYPIVYDRYKAQCDRAYDSNSSNLLGISQIVPIETGATTVSLFVVNLFAQDRYGIDKRHTNYGALASSLYDLWDGWLLHHNNSPVYIPYGLGCGLGGGSWEIVSEILEFFLPEATIVKLPE